MEEAKIFEEFIDLPDGYQIQMMVLRDFPGGRQRRGLKMSVYRSRIWIGHETEEEPLLHKSQEHPDLQVAVESCYSMLLASATITVGSTTALGALQERVHSFFAGKAKAHLA